MERPKKWSGVDLAPLPYESLANIVQRFAWHNALNASLMRSSFTQNGAGRKIDIQRFAYDSFGQAVIDIYDAERVQVSSTWYSGHLRFCPICLQELYHSSLFQCVQLVKCPLHHVALTSACQSCGAPAPLMRTGYILSRRPYECDECCAPLAGARPDITGHLLLRANVALLADRFAEVANWWARGATQRSKVDAMGRSKDRAYYACQSPEDLLQALSWPDGAEPDGIRICVNDWPSASRISWRQRMAMPAHQAGSRVPVAWRRTYEAGMYVHALRALLSRIARNLRSKELYLVAQLERFDYAGSQHMPVELLALGFMRLQIEGQWRTEDARMLRPLYSATPSPDNWPQLQSNLYDVPRVAFYSAYLGLFASWYHHARRLGWAGAWRLFREAPRPNAMVLMRNQLWCRRGDQWGWGEIDGADEVWFDGEAVTVTIQGFPLFPYRSRPVHCVPAPWEVRHQHGE